MKRIWGIKIKVEDGYLRRVRGPGVGGRKEDKDGLNMIRVCETHA